MTQKLYVGTPVDCNAVRSAMDFALGYPAPGTINGVPIVNEQTRVAMVAQWWAMPQSSRDSLIQNTVAPWIGWTLQWCGLIAEEAPGTRHATWIPGDVPGVIQAASAAGRTLTLAQTTTLTAAAAVALVAHPANWVFPE